jgi:holo-[acyl-carrier protein] synthase
VAVIGIGIDVVEVSRARAMIERHGDRILFRTLTDEERAYVATLGDAAPAFAARLAAKEAMYKALQVFGGAREIGWRDLGVARGPDGRPGATLSGKAALLAATHAVRVHLSLSHSRDVAAAVAVLERGDS